MGKVRFPGEKKPLLFSAPKRISTVGGLMATDHPFCGHDDFHWRGLDLWASRTVRMSDRARVLTQSSLLPGQREKQR